MSWHCHQNVEYNVRVIINEWDTWKWQKHFCKLWCAIYILDKLRYINLSGSPKWGRAGKWVYHIFLAMMPDSKVHRVNIGPIWGRQDPGGPQVGPMNFIIWDVSLWHSDMRWNICPNRLIHIYLLMCEYHSKYYDYGKINSEMNWSVLVISWQNIWLYDCSKIWHVSQQYCW